jgi:tRNA 2-selenouridine synthase
MARAGDHEMLARDLIKTHYDPRYAKSRARFAERRVVTVDADSLDDPALEALSGRIEAALAAM